MAVVSKSVSVSKELNEVGEAIGGIIASVKEKAAEGLSLPEIVQALTENVGKLMAAVEGADKIGLEFKEEPEAAAMAAALFGGQILGAFMKKPVAPPVA